MKVGGDKIAERAFAEQSVDDLAVGESIAFAALLVALVLIFGSVFAASLPLAVTIAGVTGSLLVLLGISYTSKVSEYSINVVTLLGIGLAVDYSLLIVARFREELLRHDPDEALTVAMARAGTAVAVSGLAVALTMAGLTAFAEPLLAAVALGGAAVVVVATLAALDPGPGPAGAGRAPHPPARSRVDSKKTWVYCESSPSAPRRTRPGPPWPPRWACCSWPLRC